MKSTVIWIYEPPIDLTDETNQSKTECQFVKEKVACLNECRFDKFKARFLVGNSGVVVVVDFDNVIGHQHSRSVSDQQREFATLLVECGRCVCCYRVELN